MEGEVIKHLNVNKSNALFCDGQPRPSPVAEPRDPPSQAAQTLWRDTDSPVRPSAGDTLYDLLAHALQRNLKTRRPKRTGLRIARIWRLQEGHPKIMKDTQCGL